VALAAVLTYGPAALPGAWLGAFLVNAGLGLVRGQSGLALVTLPAIIALGAAAQAGLGATLLRRFAGPLVVLNAPRDIALAGLLGGPLACTISTTIATLALLGTGAVPWAQAPTNWLVWWSGDTLGALIATPLVLTLIGQPAADWRPRRRTLGLPLLLALGLVSVGVAEMQRLDDLRKRALFERDAERLATEAEDRLNGALHALQALHGAALHQPAGDDRALRDASRWWLQQTLHLQATGYSQLVAEAGVRPFEAQMRAAANPEFRVFDRDESVDRRQRGELVVMRAIFPLEGNAAALGVNVLSIPAAREAVLAGRLSGQAASTVAFKLTQSAGNEQGVVLYQALYTGEPTTAEQRQAQFSGVVFVTLRIDSAFASLARDDQSHMRWCLSSQAASGELLRFAGAANCEMAATQAKDFQHLRKITWGGRDLNFNVRADPAAISTGNREAAWLLALSGMTAAAMLGALLLTVTGHARRTELAVRASTEELRGEVTERLQAEAALRESGERLRSILDNVPLGVMFLDPQGYLIECNPRLCAMTNRPPSDLVGRSVAELVHADDTGLIRSMRRDLMRGDAMSVVDALRLHDGGHTGITARVSATAMRDAKGRMLRMVAVVEDITEHLQLEASERALQRAEAANRAKSEFLSRMSHELRTPLNAMIGFAQLLGLDREPALAAHQREWTQQIQRAGWHLLDLINETLDLARIESGAVQLTLEPLPLEPMVAACRALVAGQAEQRQLRLREQLDPSATGVLADATRLKQVLTNLLSNAVKYNRVGGEVTLSSVLRPDGRVDISVTDSGLGMTPEQLSRLFQPYNRLGREHSNIEGTGIGLVITLRLTELMGGQLAVSSRVGVGSTFVLTLPGASVAVAPPERYTETSPAPYQQRLVHYVEDNETNIEVMRGVLAQRSQVVLKTSMLGLDGLEAIRRQKPDLILLDMHLPDISGLELLRHLKQGDTVADIPVIVVSADATAGQMEQALTLGALHYVTKPLEVSEFLALVDSALESADTRWGM
jgi:PAS domain S-box-containing protein